MIHIQQSFSLERQGRSKDSQIICIAEGTSKVSVPKAASSTALERFQKAICEENGT